MVFIKTFFYSSCISTFPLLGFRGVEQLLVTGLLSLHGLCILGFFEDVGLFVEFPFIKCRAVFISPFRSSSLQKGQDDDLRACTINRALTSLAK